MMQEHQSRRPQLRLVARCELATGPIFESLPIDGIGCWKFGQHLVQKMRRQKIVNKYVRKWNGRHVRRAEGLAKTSQFVERDARGRKH